MENTNGTIHWHAVDIAQAFELLETSVQGISDSSVSVRQQRYGHNRLRPPIKRSLTMRFLAQFHNVLIYVLLGACLTTLLLGHWIDAGVIFGVVFLNGVIGFIQEGKAEQALDAVRKMLSPQAVVLRDGRRQSINAEDLVPGDVVYLQSGDRVPADLRLFYSKELRIDEAMLTGESEPVEKNTHSVNADSPLGDRRGIAYSGTLVTFGQATGVVVHTGMRTEIGRISDMLAHVQTLNTPLLRQLAKFGKWLTIGILLLAVMTAIFGIVFRGYHLQEMFLAAVGLAVAAIPEGLPAIITITLAIGVQRMAKRKAIVRRLPAVETLGSVTTICSDKTGTLTRNEMTVKSVAIAADFLEVTGSGYEPRGGFCVDHQDVTPSALQHPTLLELCKAALLCNDAGVFEKDGQWHIEGDPTEGALIVLGIKAGFEPHLLLEQFPRTDIIPFESEHRFMASMHHDHAGHGFVYLKGAPEAILQRCNQQEIRGDLQPLDIAYWENRLEDIAARGQRTLAIAFRPTTNDHRELRFSDLDGGLILLGMVGLIDPPREAALESINQCQSAGIRVKMITGDHARTARAIAEQMGIGDGKRAITGDQLNQINDEQLAQTVNDIDVFARTSPEHKLRLVTALQSNGEVVSMTGDGVNDAPALKRADVGVAMGIKGTEAAKEAAEMVLADDNFATITYAVEEGRTVYDNIKKSILFILPTNGGEALTIVAAIALGRMLPVTPAQILWVNMITAVTLALALAFEPPEPGVMHRPPRDPKEPLLSKFLVWRIVFVSLIMVVCAFGLFIWERSQGSSLETARTVAVNTLVMLEIFYLFTVRFLLNGALSIKGLFGNKWVSVSVTTVVLFQLLFTYAPTMQFLFKTESIDLHAWIRIIIVSSSVFIFVELEKTIIRWLQHKSTS
ncbi:cation-transporting P-type ATPase [Kaarinaea lacus]